MTQPVRRVVTGHDDAGRAIFLSDGPAPNVNVIEAAGGMAVTELWSSDRAPADNSGDVDAAADAFVLAPTPTGNKFRIIDYPPDSARFPAGTDAAAARAMRGGADVATDTARHPGMHKTDSVDYAIVLSGEIWALMDEGETLLKAGDVLIQRGTSHAWSNRTDRPARVAFVLIGADPV